jgi:hypothetical protein
MLRAVEGTPIESRVIALATSQPDEGWGGVWPAAILVGASSAATMSAGAWLGASISSSQLPSLPYWIAEHALWGTVLGAAVTLGLRLGSSRNPALLVDARRRSIAAQVTPVTVGLAFALALLILAGSPLAAAGPLAGLALGGGLWFLGLRRWLAGVRPRDLPRLDPARVAVWVAVLTVPLALRGADGARLVDAWRAVLAP